MALFVAVRLLPGELHHGGVPGVPGVLVIGHVHPRTHKHHLNMKQWGNSLKIRQATTRVFFTMSFLFLVKFPPIGSLILVFPIFLNNRYIPLTKKDIYL